MLLRRRTGICVAAAALGLALPAGEALAYCRSTTCVGDCERDDDGCKTSGKPLFWASSCVGISLQADSSEFIPFKYFEQAAQKALVEWSDLGCETGVASIAFSALDEVDCHEAEYNESGTNANLILFQDTKWTYTDVANNLAKTTVTFDTDTGEILDADIEINHANNEFTISDMEITYDLQAILTHEIGHLIGLDHTPDFSATMYAGYEVGTTDQRSLELDDVLAICDAYPPGRDATCSPEPRGGLGNECGGVAPEDDGDGGCSTCRVEDRGRGVNSALVVACALGVLAARRRRSSKGDG